MDTFGSAVELIGSRRPERPILGLRPHAAKLAARWFLERFPGGVVYALKANDSPVIVEALLAGGVRRFDVASLSEIEQAGSLAGSELYLMNPIKSRETIARGYFEFGIRNFAFDTEAELDKILQETEHADDLSLFVRVACTNVHSLIPLEGKFGVSEAAAPALMILARAAATRLGVTFHVGSQAMAPASYADALKKVRRVIRRAGVKVDAIDVGGGFPSRYPGVEPPPLTAYFSEIERALDRLGIEGCELIAEPGRALVAEAESVIVRVEARRGNRLYINDGAFGTLYDAAHSNFIYPARVVRAEAGPFEPIESFAFYGPTCDSVDFMPGPFLLPGCVGEGDYIEIGQLGAYGRVLAGRFNGFGAYEEVLLADAPLLTMYSEPAPAEETFEDRIGVSR